MVSSFVSDRAHRGLPKEAFASKEAVASFTNGTAEEECFEGALAAIQADRRCSLAERWTQMGVVTMGGKLGRLLTGSAVCPD